MEGALEASSDIDIDDDDEISRAVLGLISIPSLLCPCIYLRRTPAFEFGPCRLCEESPHQASVLAAAIYVYLNLSQS